MNSEFLQGAPPDYNWPRCPEADQFIRQRLGDFLKGHSFAKKLSDRMMKETSTEFIVWVDHLILPAKSFKAAELLKNFGFTQEKNIKTPAGQVPLRHPYADLPRLLLSDRATDVSCAIVVEYISHFQSAHGLSLPIEGAPFSSYREMRISGGNSDLLVVARRGTHDYVPSVDSMEKKYGQAFEICVKRRREFPNNNQGMTETLNLANKLNAELGPGMAAVVFLESERQFWQKKNQAAQIQKDRQDKLGLGWANYDHHTYRSSRSSFPALINVLMALGFKKRERFYAGAEAGWGAQVMEHPEAGFVIFADVDLTPEDVEVDFTKKSLENLSKPGTVGLWCELHGESMLQAGLHHLEAQFDFDHLRDDLNAQKIQTMAPFSDFPFLRQAFTKGEFWAVDPVRLEQLKKEGKLSAEAYARIKKEGAVGSHLENLQRREGFKGFNQKSVSAIMKEVNPERQTLDKAEGA